MPTHTTAPLISVDLIDDSDRERKDLGDLSSLAESINSIGLIHPVVISDERNIQGKHNLIAGGRRLATFRALGLSEIPYNFRSVADEADLREAELEENLQRKAMHWSEYVSGIERVHTLRQLKVNFDNSKWGQTQTGLLLGIRASSVSNAIAVAKALRTNDTEVASAANLTDAIGILLGRKQDAALKALQEKETITRVVAPSVPGSDKPNTLTIDFSKSDSLNESDSGTAPFEWKDTEFDLTSTVLHGDCVQLMHSMVVRGQKVDHIITDPPYGINMENLGTITDIDRVETEHDVEENLELLPEFFKVAFNVLPDVGFCITWCDMQHFEKMMAWAHKAGFKVQRWPLVWFKSHPCINNAAQYNFTKDFEVALVCRKGNATLIKPQQTSVITANGAVERKMYRNPFAKPFEVWKWLFEAVALPGQTILDPFSGEGSMPRAAINCGLRPVCIEKSDKHYPALIEGVKEAYKLVTRGKATFK